MGNVTRSTVPAPSPVELPLPWGPIVRGMRWGEGPTIVFLLHEEGKDIDIDAWGALPGLLTRALPVQAVAVDLPGHGLSDDPWVAERLPEVIDALVGQSTGNARPILISAGGSALAALNAADRLQLAAIVALSPDDPEPHAAVPRSPGTAKTFFAGSHRANDVDVARRLAATGGGWASVTSVPVDARGSALLQAPWGPRVNEHIVAFLRDCIYRSPIRPRPEHQRAPSG